MDCPKDTSHPPEHANTYQRVACENCRAKKLRCNAKRPTCSRCQSKGLRCEYDSPERRKRHRSGDEEKIAKQAALAAASSQVLQNASLNEFQSVFTGDMDPLPQDHRERSPSCPSRTRTKSCDSRSRQRRVSETGPPSEAWARHAISSMERAPFNPSQEDMDGVGTHEMSASRDMHFPPDFTATISNNETSTSGNLIDQDIDDVSPLSVHSHADRRFDTLDHFFNFESTCGDLLSNHVTFLDSSHESQPDLTRAGETFLTASLQPTTSSSPGRDSGFQSGRGGDEDKQASPKPGDSRAQQCRQGQSLETGLCQRRIGCLGEVSELLEKWEARKLDATDETTMDGLLGFQRLTISRCMDLVRCRQCSSLSSFVNLHLLVAHQLILSFELDLFPCIRESEWKGGASKPDFDATLQRSMIQVSFGEYQCDSPHELRDVAVVLVRLQVRNMKQLIRKYKSIARAQGWQSHLTRIARFEERISAIEARSSNRPGAAN